MKGWNLTNLSSC